MAEVRPVTGGVTKKLNKSDVSYRHSERCGSCDFFRAGTCVIVDGGISAEYICDRWTANVKPKEGIHAEFYIDEYKKEQSARNQP
jgi:hypothetical protein